MYHSKITEQGGPEGKSYGLGTGWISPQHTSRRRSGGFPFSAAPRCYRYAIPDCHLVRTAIPPAPHQDSLGDFHSSQTVSYPLLQTGFQGNIISSLAGESMRQLPYPPNPRKAGYSAHSDRAAQAAVAPHCRFKSSASYTGRLTAWGVRLCTIAGLHRGRVGSPMPLGGALRPQAAAQGRASLQHPPQTGRKKQAPEVSQLCPLRDF